MTQTTEQQPSTVAEKFKALINLYKNLLGTCVEVLGPNADQAKRDQVRKAIQEYLGSEPKQPS